MAVLTVICNGVVRRHSFSPEEMPLLSSVLSDAGYTVAQPCGGRGVCGHCAVSITGNLSRLTEEERKFGTRLACRTRLLGDAVLVLKESRFSVIEGTLQDKKEVTVGEDTVIGAAVDIGTTTVVLRLYDMTEGMLLSDAAMENPQRAFAADVMGRIDHALHGEGAALQNAIVHCIGELLDAACAKISVSRDRVSRMVCAGNTTMLYLLCRRDPVSLSHAPFEADTLFDSETVVCGIPAYLPPCMNAFVGADITAAVLSSRMCDGQATALLCDIGTNGEIALWKNGTLYVTSTAAGPAFEGAGISCGGGSVPGAVDRVSYDAGNDCFLVHTVGDAPASCVCGSGLIDAAASFLSSEWVEDSGATDMEELPLSANGGTVKLLPKDIRALQLAKGAVAAGIRTLLKESGTSCSEITVLYLAGGFGSHLNLTSAAEIGLIPTELKERTAVIGNAALDGASAMLLHGDVLSRAREICSCSQHVNLGGSPVFNEAYMESMFFEAF